jgi:hypothetical protein
MHPITPRRRTGHTLAPHRLEHYRFRESASVPSLTDDSQIGADL